MQIEKIPQNFTYGHKLAEKSAKASLADLYDSKLLTNSLDCLAFAGRFSVKKKMQPIPPADFDSATLIKDEDGIIKSPDYVPSVKRSTLVKNKYINPRRSSVFESEYSTFKKELRPLTLKINNKKMSSHHISNFVSPSGTIAISTKFHDKVTSTDGLLQCIGVAFIDKKNKIQTLLHLCPTVNKNDNDSLIHYIMSYSKPNDLEITIAPGHYDETDNTVEYFLNTIKDYKGAKIKFANFPDFQNTTLILNNGKLSCCGLSDQLQREINPKGKLIHAGTQFSLK